MASRGGLGKPLSGGGGISPKNLASIQNSFANAVTSSNLVLNNVSINGGEINNTVIGANGQGQGFFSGLNVGLPNGTGAAFFCVYGNTIPERMCWIASQGLLEVVGDLSISQVSDLGNLRLAVNTISATNTNGGINLSSNGTGTVNISGGGFLQTTATGNIIMNASTGTSTTTARNINVNSFRNTNNTTTDGSINFRTGSSIINNAINFITTGLNPTVTTTLLHGYVVGDKVSISGTSELNGVYTITSVPSTTSFTVASPISINNISTAGNVVKRNDINLNPFNKIFVSEDKPIAFGNETTEIYGDGVDLNITSSNDINLSSSRNINIPNNKLLTFGNDTRSLSSDGDDLILNTGRKVIINGDLTVTGVTTQIITETTTLKDPVITLGGTEAVLVSDTKDRGVEYRYNNGASSKIGFFGKNTSTGCFTYIPDAVNNGEIFSGTPGCAVFGSTSVTNLNLNGGSITNTGALNACNLTCSSNMTISSDANITITSPNTTINTQLSISDNIINTGTSSSLTSDKGISFNYFDGTNKLGFIGWDSSADCFKFLKDTTITNDIVTSGVPGNMCLGNTTINNLNVSGEIVGGVLPEHITGPGSGTLNFSATKPITFINITTSGTATGTLLPGPYDGFSKMIYLASKVTGGIYSIICPNGRLIDPGSGTSSSKTITFNTAGQSIHLLWNSVVGSYYIVNSGACIS